MGSAFLSALYLAAMSLYAGPTNFLSAAWHARQFFCFANSALATAGPAIVSMPHAPTKAAAANFVFIIAPYVDIADKFNGNTTDWLTSNTPRIGLDRRLYLRSVTSHQVGTMWLIWLGVAMIVLKVLEISVFSELSWWWVALPFGVGYLWFELVEKRLGLDKKKAFDKMDKAKKDRIKKRLETDKNP